jgi:hypothetical protein
MSTVAPNKQPIMVRPDRDLHERVRAAGRLYGSMNRWALEAFRQKLAREAKGQDKPTLTVEPHHEDPRDEFERTWAHALIRRLRSPGKARPLLDHLAEIWHLPELPKMRR